MLCLVIMVCITSHYTKIGLLYRTLGDVDYIYQNEIINNKMTVNFLRGLWAVAPHYRPHGKNGSEIFAKLVGYHVDSAYFPKPDFGSFKPK